MNPFPASQVPDEGYSEDPLNPSTSSANDRASAVAALARLTSAADFSVWLSRHLSAMPPHVKQQLAMAILEDLPTSAIADIVQRLNHRLYIDFSGYLPPEICLKILSYLDPVSLVSAARTCRSWYTLALDRKLWQKLYYLEGWKAIPSEIDAWEARVNEDHNTPSATHRLQSENGHTAKKRAFTPGDQDMEMVDAESPNRSADPSQIASIFGGPVRPSSSRSSSTPQPDHYMMDVSSPRVDRGSSTPRDVKGKSICVREESLPDLAPGTTLPQSTLWLWDSRHKTYKINWKYLYNMRRRLERNWEEGLFTNFQLPHPDYPEEGHSECIYNIQYDSEYLVSGSRDRTLRIWSLQTRRLVRPPLTGHEGSVLCLQFDTDPDEDLIVSGSSDSDVIMWKFSTGEMLQRLSKAHTESVLNVKFDKRILVTCSKDKTIKIFNRQPLRYGDLGYPRPGDIKDDSIHIVDPVPVTLNNYGFDQSPRATMPVIPPYTMIRCLEGHGAAVNAVQVCGGEVVSASGDRNIKLWDWHNRLCKRTFLGHTKGIACVQYDGRRIVSGSNDNAVRIFDRETGLEVASLHHHTELVRTLQAGFGDLPYSVTEDMAEAKAVDAEYFKAVEAGIVPINPTNRGRVRNAGSRRPQDIVAYGAKLPPGGGGGKYGRIVSGSYDQTIIIWRRDKEGVWKPAHILDREEAAANAAKRVVPAARPDDGAAQVHPLVRPGSGDVPVVGTVTPQSVASFQAMIDNIVPQGPSRLSQALANYPTMLLSCYGYLQGVIDSQNDATVRGQLQQVVQTAVVRTQMAQARAQQLAQNATTTQAGPSVATGGQQHITAVMATSTATAGAGQGQAANGGGNLTVHHPHIPSANNGTPIRIFKLQFDARRIICCSTTGAIVGWDFCNGDVELEEACRFFATID